MDDHRRAADRTGLVAAIGTRRRSSTGKAQAPVPPSSVPFGGRSIGSWLVPTSQRGRDCRWVGSNLSHARYGTNE